MKKTKRKTKSKLSKSRLEQLQEMVTEMLIRSGTVRATVNALSQDQLFKTAQKLIERELLKLKREWSR